MMNTRIEFSIRAIFILPMFLAITWFLGKFGEVSNQALDQCDFDQRDVFMDTTHSLIEVPSVSDTQKITPIVCQLKCFLKTTEN